MTVFCSATTQTFFCNARRSERVKELHKFPAEENKNQYKYTRNQTRKVISKH